MDFAWAINALKQGQKVTRKIWEGDPSYIELTAPGSNSIIAVGDDTQVENWLCLHSDILADDWEEYVEPKKEPIFGNTRLSFDENGQPHIGDTTTVDEYQRMHIGDKKSTFQDLCDDYLSQQKGTCYIGKSIMPERKEICRSDNCPKLTTVWTTLYDLGTRDSENQLDEEDYPYTLCERDVLEQHGDKVMVLAEPGFSQRTVMLFLDGDCWDSARATAAGLVHRVATRYGWNMEFFISLLKNVDVTEGNYNMECHGAGSATLGEVFAEDMEYWAQENAKTLHRLRYIINQYINIVRSSASARKKED